MVLLSPYLFTSRSPALAEWWCLQIAGGSGPWVPFFILGSLESLPRQEVKSLLISHSKIIFALYFSFLNMIVLSKEMF